MELSDPLIQQKEKQQFRLAFGLAVFTIVYNLIEGFVATGLGYVDESLTLFGFGTDSFIEMISGTGIAHMIFRIQRNPGNQRSNFERTALRITGFSFYMLVVGLVITSFYNLFTDHRPVTTFWGVIISSVSIIIMFVLILYKTRVGKALDSRALLADAECTRVCIYMSVILLVSSGIYELTQFAWLDSAGGLGLAWFSFREGRECFMKAKSNAHCGCKIP